MERLGDRIMPAVNTSWTGAEPINGHPGGDGHSWQDGNNWFAGVAPTGATDGATIPAIGGVTIDGATPSELSTLVINAGSGATINLSRNLQVDNGFQIHGGIIDGPAGTTITLSGVAQAVWDSGTIGLTAGSTSAINVMKGSTLFLGSTTRPAAINRGWQFVVGGDGTTCTLCYVSVTDSVSNSAPTHIKAGNLMYLGNNQNPPSGDVIQYTGNTSSMWLDDLGSVYAASEGTQTCTHMLKESVAVGSGGLFEVESHNSVTDTGNASNTFLSAISSKGGTIRLGDQNAGDSAPGNATLTSMLSDTVLDNATFMIVTGTKNIFNSPASNSLIIGGTLKLDNPGGYGTWQQSTLLVGEGGLIFGAASTFTLFAWYSSGQPTTHCLYDWVSVADGSVTVSSLGNGKAILNPWWAGIDSGDSYLGNANLQTFLGVTGGGNFQINPATFGVQENPPPGYGWAGWIEAQIGTPVTSLDLNWQG